MKKNVALVLSSGGPRGFAYIGAIEELIERGYTITSVAGSSIGALIGGMYAAGGLEKVKDWLFSVSNFEALSLMDFSISSNHIVKGDKIMDAFKEIVPDVNIEDLSIPYKAIATDFYTGEEVIFDKGSLYPAIRASISVPSLFRPVKIGGRTLIDGGVTNTFPLNRVTRTEGDILVGFDVNQIDVAKVREILADDEKLEADKETKKQLSAAQGELVWDTVRNDDTMSLVEKIKLAGTHGQKVIRQTFERDPKPSALSGQEQNYYGVLTRTFNIMNHVIAEQMLQMIQPDILVEMPFDDFNTFSLADYTKAADISAIGRDLMRAALDNYESVAAIHMDI